MTGTVVVQRAEDESDERRAQRLVQAGPEGAREARVAVRDEHVRQPHVAELRRDEVARSGLGGGGLEP